MHQIFEYDLYIFDCDGVILDSNDLKIEAMEQALYLSFSDTEIIKKCINYFSSNFGKSRYHHIEHFLENIFKVPQTNRQYLKEEILKNYSNKCQKSYIEAKITDGFLSFIQNIEGKKFVASGSEQVELRNVLSDKKMNLYFNEIYGSPQKKDLIIEMILKNNSYKKAVMIGDAKSDYEASKKNNIDFIFYSPYSNVKKEMKHLSIKENFTIMKNWPL